MKWKIWDNWGKKYLYFVLAAFIVLGIAPVQKVSAMADYYVENNFKNTIIYNKNPKEDNVYNFQMLDISTPLKKVKITSSNTAVATVENAEWDGVNPHFKVTSKKKGTTKITVTGTSNGKKISVTGTVKVVNYENPFKKLTFCGKSYRSKIDSEYKYIYLYDGTVINMEYKLKPGWKMISAEMEGFKDGSYNKKKVKSGKTYQYPSDTEHEAWIMLLCENKSKGVRQSVRFVLRK